MIEIGEYVRTKEGKIYKITNYDEEQNKYHSATGLFLYIIFPQDIVKYSKNIIDLIEVGDYVNGILVTGKESTLLYTEIKGIDRSGYHIPISQYGENVKSIVTKEQFANIEYRLEENK